MSPRRAYKFVYDPEREVTQLWEMMVLHAKVNPEAVKQQLQDLLDNYKHKKQKEKDAFNHS